MGWGWDAQGRDESGARILSVSIAYSQGAGTYNPNANHPVGRSQVRQQAPRGTDSSQKSFFGYQSEEDNAPCYPRGTPCKSRAPDQRPKH